MAEEDVMLVAIRMDAKGAITDTQILDDKFKNLSTTFRKGSQETETLTQVTAKQVETTKDDSNAQTARNTSYISGLAAMEAVTSFGKKILYFLPELFFKKLFKITLFIIAIRLILLS